MSEPASRFPHPPRWRPSWGGLRSALILGVAGFGLIVTWQFVGRLQARADLERRTELDAVPPVNLIAPQIAPDHLDLTLPGTTQALAEAVIFARTSGYVKSWTADIGAKVKKGEVLARIDAPEVDEQLRQSEADLSVAEANLALSETTARRWQTLVTTSAVSHQAADEKIADARAKAAQVASARANVLRLRQLIKFKEVVAPFDGVITVRKVDVGTLVNAGAGQGSELFHVADLSKLRVYVQTPQQNARLMQIGGSASLVAPDRPNQDIAARIVRTAEAINPLSRTLTVELQIDNADGALFAGAYVDVHFSLPVTDRRLTLPVNAVLFRPEGPVAAIFQAGPAEMRGEARIRSVKIGLDFGARLEVLSGVTADDRVIINPPDSIGDGQNFRLALIPPKA